MLWCDPEFLGVFPYPPGSRVQIPEKPWARFGTIRNVVIHEADDPITCVCFALTEMADVLGCVFQTMQNKIADGSIPRPVFFTEVTHDERAVRSGKAVYLLPEAEILLRSFRPKEERPKGPGNHRIVQDPEYLNRAILEVRAILTERIDL